MAKQENDLGRDAIGTLVLRIAVPSMLAQFVSVLYSIVDRMYIGNIPMVGDVALAGVGVCGPVVTMVGSVAFLIGVGGAPLMSIKLGEKGRGGRKAHHGKLLSDVMRQRSGPDGGHLSLCAAHVACVRRVRGHAALCHALFHHLSDGHALRADGNGAKPAYCVPGLCKSGHEIHPAGGL